MNYTFYKLAIAAFCSIFVLVGLGMSLAGNFMGLLFLLGGLAMGWTKIRQLSRFQRMTYAWYRAQQPGAVRGDQVVCHACGSDRIHVRALMNRTFHREHFCTRCGTTLYYSPEQY